MAYHATPSLSFQTPRPSHPVVETDDVEHAFQVITGGAAPTSPHARWPSRCSRAWGSARGDRGPCPLRRDRPLTRSFLRSAKAHIRSIEAANTREHAIVYDRGVLLDLAVTYRDVDGARSEIALLQSRGELDPQRVYLVVWRPTPKGGSLVPEQVVVAAQRSFSTPETVGAPCDNQTLSADSSRSTRGVA